MIKKPNLSEEEWQDLFRSTLAQTEDSDRFRQAFYQMLVAQDHIAFRVFEGEIRQLRFELSDENLYSQLKKYLSSGDWRKADEETAWIFYWAMLKQDCQNWFELCQKFPDEIFKGIDDLWITHSKGRFGLSIQRHLWESCGGTFGEGIDCTKVYDFYESPEQFECWIKFCKKVEWCISEEWILENSDLLSLEFMEPYLTSYERYSKSSMKRQRQFVRWISYKTLFSLSKYKKELAMGALPALYANGQWGFLFKKGIGGGNWGIRKELRAFFLH